MVLLPGLTSTVKTVIQPFLEDMLRYKISRIALFPTCLSREERQTLYDDLERIPDLVIPHVHLRSDCGEGEIEYLSSRFGTEAFNIHPAKSTHPFGRIPARFARRFFIENVEVTPEDDELSSAGGLCPDYSHLENSRLHDRTGYVDRMHRFFSMYPIGCCHVSAVRQGVPNGWTGGWDHHSYKALADFRYLTAYRAVFPARWASLELENSLAEQLAAARYINSLISMTLATGD